MSNDTNKNDFGCNVEILEGPENFSLWKFQLKITLNAAESFDALTYDDVPKTEDTKKKDAKAQKAIATSISKRNQQIIMSCETAAAMYKKLCSMYEGDTDQLKEELLKEYFNFRMESDIAKGISDLENIKVRLKSVGHEITDTEMVQRILSALPESYQYFIPSWQSAARDERTVANLITRLMALERSKTRKNPENDIVAFKTTKKEGHQNFSKNGNEPYKCFTCGSTSHFKRSCPQNGTRCRYCKKTNHRSEKCFFRDQHENKDNNSETVKNTDNDKNPGNDKNDKVAYLTHTSDYAMTTSHGITFFVDSGSSHHMTNDASLLTDFKTGHDEIQVAQKGLVIKSTGTGTMDTVECTLKNVLLVPGLDSNLISVGAITRNGGDVIFTNNEVQIKKGNSLIRGLRQPNGLYKVVLVSEKSARSQCLHAIKSQKNDEYWHRVLGHLSYKNLKKLDTQLGLSLHIDENKNVCEICVKSKQTRLPFSSQRARATRPLEIIHTDVCQIETTTWDKYRYILTCYDDFTCFKQIYLLRKKSETFQNIKDYVAEVEAKWNLPVSKLRCDGGGEFMNHDMKNWAKSKGIIMDVTISHSPQLNAKAERLNRSIMDKTRALLFDSAQPAEMWGEAARVACYILNRCPTEALPNGKTPHEMWFSKKPDLQRMHLFGCIAYAKILTNLKKLDSRTKKYIHVGYQPNGYRLWDANSRKIVYARDVIFENEMPLKCNTISYEDVKITTDVENQEYPDAHIEDADTFGSDSEDGIQNEGDTHNEGDTQNQGDTQNEDEDDIEELGRGKRLKRAPLYLQNYVLLTYTEALSGPNKDKWIEAIQDEKNSLDKNHTWELVDRHSAGNNKILTNKWVFKQKDDGRFRARLVIRGCEQEYGLNYEETFSPVINSSSMRIIFGLAAVRDYRIIKFDIKTAFLYGDIQEDVFMELPEGYEQTEKICKLKKSLYGLKQASLKWNQRFTSFLRDVGLNPAKSDPCVFTNKEKTIILALYVDDGLLVGQNLNELRQIIKIIESEFEVQYDEDPTSFLGMEVQRDSQSLKLSQRAYAENILERFSMQDSKPKPTPMLKTNEDDDEKGDFQREKFPYREAVGSLLYASNKTRPDLAFSVGYASRKLQNPSNQDAANVKRIFRYLNGTKSDGITFKKNGQLSLEAFSDADWAEDPSTRRSTTGYIVFFCGGPISWASRRQPNVTKSSTESEYVSAADCCAELMFLKTLIEEVTDVNIDVNLNVDNQSSIKLIKNGILRRKSKHIEVKYYFIKEKVDENQLKINYVPTESQTADILTKPLATTKFNEFKKLLVN